MASIAYVDHSYHMKTISTKFLATILRDHGHVVDNFWDDSWRGGAVVPWESVDHYDAIIMFQAFCPISRDYFRRRHPNVTYVPMLDQWGLWDGPSRLESFWEPFQGSKILSFSTAAHAIATCFGLGSFYVRYYQPPLPAPAAPKEGLHGFFWLRRENQIPWRTIEKLIENTSFDSMHVHIAVDPGSPAPQVPSDQQCRRFNISKSTWFENKLDLNHVQEKANVFFAPRLAEGIGQSFLEAFSRGQCVVAADQGTMNEYILHGVNGLLYNEKIPSPLDFSRAIEMGIAGWKSACEGRARWESLQEDIVRFILTPSKEIYKEYGSYIPGFSSNNCEFSRATLREYIRKLSIVRKTRPIWHPIWRRLH